MKVRTNTSCFLLSTVLHANMILILNQFYKRKQNQKVLSNLCKITAWVKAPSPTFVAFPSQLCHLQWLKTKETTHLHAFKEPNLFSFAFFYALHISEENKFYNKPFFLSKHTDSLLTKKHQEFPMGGGGLRVCYAWYG